MAGGTRKDGEAGEDSADGPAPDSGTCRTYLQYAGLPGVTRSCREAVERLLCLGSPLQRALILTCKGPETSAHALLLTDVHGVETVVKSGFNSGYGGEGPRGLSATLALLDWHGIGLEEILVDEGLLDRLDSSALTVADLEAIRSAPPVRPRLLWDYIFEEDARPGRDWNPWLRSEPIVPLAMIDERLAAEARDFWADPDGKLMKAHRRLEESVRVKAGISLEDASGGPARMYSLAFNGKRPRLRWPGIIASEHSGRANLFLGVLAACRNPRAHRTERGRRDRQLDELLLLNHLFRLEAAAEPNPAADDEEGDPS